MKPHLHRLLHVFVVLGLLATLLPTVQVAEALSPNVVISQVYGGGGNNGGVYTNDFIELFNRGTTTIDLSTWSIQYTSATGTGNFGSATNLITPLSGTIAPGQYVLIEEAAGTNTILALPAPDITDTTPINMSGSGAKVALVNSTTPLGCNGGSTPCTPAQLAMIVDLLGWGSANFYEGAAAGATANATAAIRNGGGCTETDNNSADFTIAAPTPRNRASALNVCAGDSAPAVSSTAPANNAVEVAVNSNITVTFSEPVNVTDPWFTLSCTLSNAHTTAVSGGPTVFTLDPSTDFVQNDVCTLTITAANVADQDANDPPDKMTADHIVVFRVVTAPIPIHNIQGAGHLSPFSGQTVKTTGIVTALRTTGGTRGFYLQTPESGYDADIATSEGIFVFTGGSSNPATMVAVGDSVQVVANVSEYRGATTSLGLTELTSPVVTMISRGNALPAPIILGTGGRIPPASVIDDDATGNVETSGTFDAATDGIDFYESLEGMLVQVNDAVAVGPFNDFGSNHEIPVIGDNGANAGVRTTRGGIVIQATDYNPERIILNDWISGGPILPAANVGDAFPGTIVGVIDYSYSNFKLQVISMPTLVPGGLAQEVAAAPGAYQLAVATFNVENLAPSDPPSKFATLAGLIVNNLLAPDIIAVEEIQDNSGATDDGVVDASITWGMLIAAIQAAGGPTYQYRQVDPQNKTDGGAPGGNIRQGFLFRTDRGLAFVDAPGATATAPTTVTGSGAATALTLSPGRIAPTNMAFLESRKPLAGQFTYMGSSLFVIANHFNSKGGDDPLFGRYQPPTLVSEVQRLLQAAVVQSFVNAIAAADPAANIVVLGDLNDFQFSQPLTTLKSAGLVALMETLPLAERYSYVYEGNSQALDHIMVNTTVFNRTLTYDVIHVNAEFAVQASDHDPQVAYIYTAPTPTSTPTPTRVPTRPPTQTPTPTQTRIAVPADLCAGEAVLRVNSGGLEYLDSTNALWWADQPYTPTLTTWGWVPAPANTVFATSQAINNTTDPVLYQTERWWPGNGGYRAEVANGFYRVQLKFAEIYPWAARDTRVFDVAIEGYRLVQNLDVVRAANPFTAHDVQLDVAVNDGLLSIDLLARVGNPAIKAVAVYPLAACGGATPHTPTPTATATTVVPVATVAYRVNAGGGAYVDGAGNAWSADQAYTAGGWGYAGGFGNSVPSAINGSSDDALYQSERWWNGAGVYKFTVPNGAYDVVLKFAEIYPYTYRGARVFDVRVEGALVRSSLDILAVAGMNTAYDVTAAGVQVQDGVLQIDLTSKAGAPKISAIDIQRVGP